jgi:hypothetical protein
VKKSASRVKLPNECTLEIHRIIGIGSNLNSLVAKFLEKHGLYDIVSEPKDNQYRVIKYTMDSGLGENQMYGKHCKEFVYKYEYKKYSMYAAALKYIEECKKKDEIKKQKQNLI